MEEKEICEHLDAKALKLLELFPEIYGSDCLRDYVADSMYFAGGCIYSLRHDRMPNDYDVFLRDDTLFETIAGLDVWKHKSEYALSRGKFQLVTKFFGDPHDNVGEFDFKHNQYWYVPFSHRIESYQWDNTWDYLNTDTLLFNENRPREVERVYARIPKFVKRGMKISLATRVKILKRCALPTLIKEYYALNGKYVRSHGGGY